MSDTGEGAPAEPAPPSPEQAQITALVGELTAKKQEFFELSAAATADVQAEVAKVRDAGAQASGLQTALAAAKVAIDTDQAALAQAAEKGRASVGEIEALKTAAATAKGGIDATLTAVTIDGATAKQSKVDIEALEAEARARSEKLSADHTTIAKEIAGLQAQQVALQGLLEELATAKATASADAAAVKAEATAIAEAKANFDRLTTETQGQHDALVARQAALDAKIQEIDDANVRIKALRQSLLEDTDGAKSVQSEINELRDSIVVVLREVTEHRATATASLDGLVKKAEADGQTLQTTMTNKFTELHDALQKQILALLPSAGAAGLASTYYDAKSRYAPTSFAGKPGGTTGDGLLSRVRAWFGYNPVSIVTTIFFYLMFVAPLILLAYGTYELVQQVEHHELVLDWQILALRFLVAVPLATISGFGFASLNRSRNLFEEYNHKQRVMELYESFRHEIDANGDEEQKKALLTIMLNSVADKAGQNIEDGSRSVSINGALETMEKAVALVAKIKTGGA